MNYDVNTAVFNRTVRQRWLEAVKALDVRDDVDGVLARTFAAGGRASFACVRHGREFDRPGVVALVPRHMSARHWQALYALSVSRLVVYGREVGDLCSNCFENITCLQAGRGRLSTFRCRASSDLLTLTVSRRANGRDKT